jgi:predicted GNAT family N-acyltransferase
MIRIDLMEWERARAAATPIRFTVFVQEQNVPPEIEMDEHDAQCVHALAFNENGEPIATGRLLPDGHIGRMAVLKGWRKQGVGGAILEALVAAAHERGDREVVLSSQTHALEFYRRHGFTEEGAIYEDAGIPHQAMRRSLLLRNE